MKKIGIIILLAAIIMNGFCLKVAGEVQGTEKQENPTSKDEDSKFILGNDLMSIDKNDSSINFRIGNRGLSILESLEGNKVNFRKYTNNDQDSTYSTYSGHDHSTRYREYSDNSREDNYKHFDRRRDRFRGHWAGIELGFNSYVTSDNSITLPNDIDYMTLNSGKSSSFNINFTQLSIGLSRHIGFVTGLGLNWNNYRFDGNNNIIKGDNNVIEELDPGSNLKKSKLATLFLTVPLMLEIQLPVHHNNLSLGAGPIAAVKLGSHTKMVLEDGHTVKSYGDFSLNMLRYGATARVGYGNFQLYGTYYKTPLFQTGKGPAGNDLYPFEIGVAFTFND
jgi:hypothetical protein